MVESSSLKITDFAKVFREVNKMTAKNVTWSSSCTREFCSSSIMSWLIDWFTSFRPHSFLNTLCKCSFIPKKLLDLIWVLTNLWVFRISTYPMYAWLILANLRPTTCTPREGLRNVSWSRFTWKCENYSSLTNVLIFALWNGTLKLTHTAKGIGVTQAPMLRSGWSKHNLKERK